MAIVDKIPKRGPGRPRGSGKKWLQEGIDWDAKTSIDVAEILERVSKMLNKRLKSDDTKQVKDLGVLLGVLIDKKRLLDGKHTQAIAIVSRDSGIEALSSIMSRMERNLACREAATPDLDK